MAKSMDIKVVLNHLVNGTINKELCLICLLPLGKNPENIFTRFCKRDIEYCVADVLEEVCNIELSSTDQHNICSSCFTTAAGAYKFYLQAKQSQHILNFYVDELIHNVYSMCIPEEIDSEDSLCFSLPWYKPLEKIDFVSELHKNIKTDYQINKKKSQNIVVATQADGYNAFKVNEKDNSLYNSNGSKKTYVGDVHIKGRRTRLPMTYKMCSKCPVKYRFGAKLKEHMKAEHDVDLFICKVCKEMIEGEIEFNNHLRMHTDIHTCDICSTVFKKRDTIINHLKWHEETKTLSKKKNAHVCEKCGYIVANLESLMEHNEKKHERKFSCSFCGKLYRGEMSLNTHLRKHELYLKMEQKQIKTEKTSSPPQPQKRSSFPCSTCNKTFVDERSLLWHSRLHTNERPYKCQQCGRGFISVNRRNQHAVCAHTPPARRCPLCPALFHLNSMITTHVKKVHLKEHKRRNRTSKHHNVSWRTETVPIHELSMSIQAPLMLIKKESTD